LATAIVEGNRSDGEGKSARAFFEAKDGGFLFIMYVKLLKVHCERRRLLQYPAHSPLRHHRL
jgi:hypothetical protein